MYILQYNTMQGRSKMFIKLQICVQIVLKGSKETYETILHLLRKCSFWDAPAIVKTMGWKKLWRCIIFWCLKFFPRFTFLFKFYFKDFKQNSITLRKYCPVFFSSVFVQEIKIYNQRKNYIFNQNQNKLTHFFFFGQKLDLKRVSTVPVKCLIYIEYR